MVFIDDLAVELFSLSFVGLLAIYMTVKMYLAYRNGAKDLEGYVSSGIVPMLMLGIFIFVMGIDGLFTWPLPGSYNILFYDPYTMLGIILIGASISVFLKQKLQYVGFLSMITGLVLIDYGVQGYNIGLTQEPVALLGLYLAFGLAGVLAFPVSLLVDKVNAPLKKPSAIWTLFLIGFWLFLLAASLVAAYIGSSAISFHLVSAP